MMNLTLAVSSVYFYSQFVLFLYGAGFGGFEGVIQLRRMYEDLSHQGICLSELPTA